MNNRFSIKNKVIIVTGSRRGIGKAFAEEFTKEGAIVYAISKSFSRINNERENNLHKIKCDLKNKKEFENICKKIFETHKKIDVLINNAAYQGNDKIRTTNFENLDVASWDKAIDVNLTGIFRLCQQVGKIMLKQKSGNIINISSIYGIVGADQRIYGTSGLNSAVFYATTKSAVLNLTRYLASYWNRTGIRVNTLSPGGVQNNQQKKFIKKYSDKTMIGRMAKQDEYVGALVFLSSDASSYMTGSNLIIDGGWTAW